MVGKKSDDPNHVDYVPSVLTYLSKPGGSSTVDRYKRCKNRNERRRQMEAKRLYEEKELNDAANSLITLSNDKPRFSDKCEFYTIHTDSFSAQTVDFAHVMCYCNVMYSVFFFKKKTSW